MQIKEVFARAILDSRGQQTIEVSVNGCSASAPSGKSTGKYETPCYHNNLQWNIDFINSTNFQIDLDSFADLIKLESFIKKEAKLKDVKSFGANALFALESATLKALAKSQGKRLWQILNSKSKKIPIPVGNIIGGGLHSYSRKHPTFQEFLIIPNGKSAKDNSALMQVMHKKVKNALKSNRMNDEGAWETSLNAEQILDLLTVFKKRNNFDVGIDVAASSFYCEGNYNYTNKHLDKDAQIAYINDLINRYNILYIEDPLDEEDFDSFSKLSKKHMIVGDDLTVTHLSRLKKAVQKKSINSIIIKPNQNGSLLEVKEIVDFCKKNKINTILSHRSGETMDSAIADYAFGLGCDYFKCGIATKWREAKMKRLVEIEKEIKN